MRFRVPQFIDMEDKIFGPFTLKQFAYILGAGGFSFLIWTFIPVKIIAVVLIVPTAAFFLSLAFVNINGRPFVDIIESALKYYSGSKIYTWKQPTENDQPTQITEKAITDTAKDIAIAKADANKLHDIALGLDVFDKQDGSQ